MTQTGYSNAVVNAMLGWLKGLASWVLKLFNLSGGFSPLKFLADNWLQLLILLLAIGVALDLLIWLVRWRPHWVWFRKKRVVINDRNFFANERYFDDEDEWDAPRRSAQPAKPRRDWEDSDFVVRSEASRGVRQKKDAAKRSGSKPAKPARRSAAQEPKDVFQSDLFNVNAEQKFSDKYEDEVFNVASLPRPERRKKSGARQGGKSAGK